MKGQIATPALMKAVLALQSGLRTSRCICQVVLMEIPRDRRRFLLSDTGITIQPTLEQKADILQSLVEVATLLREPDSADLPRVAAMAASEKPSPAMPDTLEAAELRGATWPEIFPAAWSRDRSPSTWPMPRTPVRRRRSQGA